MFAFAASLPAGQRCEACRVVVERDRYDKVEVVRLTPMQVHLERESVGSDQDKGRIGPEVGELAKRCDLFGKEDRH